MSEWDSVIEDVKPPIPMYGFVGTEDSKMTLVDLPMKTGEIFRNNDGHYSFMCFNCGLIFEDFGEIVNHCETHYQHDIQDNVSELVLCDAETVTEGQEACSPPSTETMAKSVPNESTSVATKTSGTSPIRRRRRKPKKEEDQMLNFPQYCPQCGKWCDNFVDHVKTEHSFLGKIFQCILCKRCFKNFRLLRVHLSTNVHKTNATSCYCCAMEPPITSPSAPRRHKCLFCKEWFENHAAFKIHFKVAHDQDADTFFAKRINCNIFTCFLCEKEFPLRYYLVAHMKIHYDKYLSHTCPTCGRRLRTFGQLTQHLKTHEGKVYHCDQCDKQFPHYVRLKLHKRCHVTERNFACDQCPKTFTQRKYLKVHQAVHSTGVKKYSCKFCSASFNFTSGRRAHEKSQHNVL